MNRLRELREKANLQQRELALIIGKSPQAYNHYENGRRELDNNTLRILAQFFNVSIEYLLGSEEAENTHKEELLHNIESVYYLLSEQGKAELYSYAQYLKSKNERK